MGKFMIVYSLTCGFLFAGSTAHCDPLEAFDNNPIDPENPPTDSGDLCAWARARTQGTNPQTKASLLVGLVTTYFIASEILAFSSMAFKLYIAACQERAVNYAEQNPSKFFVPFDESMALLNASRGYGFVLPGCSCNEDVEPATLWDECLSLEDFGLCLTKDLNFENGESAARLMLAPSGILFFLTFCKWVLSYIDGLENLRECSARYRRWSNIVLAVAVSGAGSCLMALFSQQAAAENSFRSSLEDYSEKLWPGWFREEGAGFVSKLHSATANERYERLFQWHAIFMSAFGGLFIAGNLAI